MNCFRNPTRRKTALLAPLCATVFALGCGSTRTVYVRDGEPMRLRQPLPKVKVWVRDKSDKEVPGEVDIPEGWYALPDPGEPEK